MADAAVATSVTSLDALIQIVAVALGRRHASIAGSVVLLPFPQLCAPSRQAWFAHAGQGFTPRFETALQCSNRLGGPRPGVGDITFDPALDRLSAQVLLRSAGLDADPSLVSRLVERAQVLAQPAAAAGPDGRSSWAENCRHAVAWDAACAALDTALSRIAIEWCAASAFATDVLFDPAMAESWDCLFVLEGFHRDPILAALLARWADTAIPLCWAATATGRPVSVGCALSAEDEAEQGAALVLQHIEQRRVPVALIANDRFLTRRVAAQLSVHGVRLRDETGWKLSTTRAAAQFMGSVRACAWNASSEQVLEWVKNAPSFGDSEVAELEQQLRAEGEAQWQRFVARRSASDQGLISWLAAAENLRANMRESRTLIRWLADSRGLLQATNLWDSLCVDAAGEQIVQALRLAPLGTSELGRFGAAGQRWSLSEFAAWADAVLEARRFIPPEPGEAEVVILPMGQMLGRDFAAVVVPGCDDIHLSASPEPEGPWTAAQRTKMGLPTRADLELVQRRSWDDLVNSYPCQLLWREKGREDEPALPSPLLRALQVAGLSRNMADPRQLQKLLFLPLSQPQPQGKDLPITSVSASGYEDLRRCPYRYFALRQLGLRESEEIELELDKRDFGLWLHDVLRRFHEGRPSSADADELDRWLDQCAQSSSAASNLDEAEFLPFQALWPNIRKAYLAWLGGRETGEAAFESAETWLEQELGPLRLVGKLDRIDRLPNGAPILIDYKTESIDKTRRRIADPGEDTQLAFYAALIDADDAQACYLNIGERGDIRELAQPNLLWARDALLGGIQSDLGRVRAGAPMAALGEGASCEHCAARGLCRKDFWNQA